MPNTDYLDISDEDFKKLAEPEEVIEGTDPEPETEPEKDEPETTIVEDTSDEKDPEDEPEEETTDPEPEEEKDPEPKEEEQDGESDKEANTETPKEEPTVDYQKAYETVMGKFKANGMDMQAKSPEDAIRLMQMGANYHQKMAGMKPAQTALKLLQNNGLLDEGKLDLLIEANNGNKEAITKLVQQHGIDPLDISKEKSEYIPNKHSVSDEELALESVLGDIQNSPNYEKTLQTITTEWDKRSQEILATNPEVITQINGHMDNGVYDTVMTEVNYQRSMGNMKYLSDLQAYEQVGNRLEAEGKFRQVNPDEETKPEPKVKKVDPIKEKQRLESKKKATKTKTIKNAKIKPDFNPLLLSDEDFKKFDPKTIGIK